MGTNFYIITITSVWNGERSCTITVNASTDLQGLAAFSDARKKAEKAWVKRYPGISNDGFAVDFYHLGTIK